MVEEDGEVYQGRREKRGGREKGKSERGREQESEGLRERGRAEEGGSEGGRKVVVEERGKYLEMRRTT